MSSADKKPVGGPQEEPKKIAVVVPTKEMQAKQDNEPEEECTAKQLKRASETNEVKQVQKDNEDDQEDQGKTDTANPQLHIKSSMPEVTAQKTVPVLSNSMPSGNIQGTPDSQTQGMAGREIKQLEAQPTEEAPEDVKYVFSVEKMKQSLLESMMQEAMLLQSTEMKALLLGNKTAAAPPIKSAEDRLAKKRRDREDREFKKDMYGYWLALMPTKKVISTLIKSRQTPKLKWLDVHKVTAGNGKHLKYKRTSYKVYEKDGDAQSCVAAKPV